MLAWTTVLPLVQNRVWGLSDLGVFFVYDVYESGKGFYLEVL